MPGNIRGRAADADEAAGGTDTDRGHLIVTEEIDDLSKLDELRGTWTNLLEGNPSDSLFLTWGWVRTWWRHLGQRRVLRILAVRRGGRLIGLAPLATVTPRPQKLLPFHTDEFAGRGPIGPDYLDLIVARGEEAAAIDALAERLAAARRVLTLSGVAAGPCPAFRLTQNLDGRGGSVASRRSGACPCIRLEGYTWESYLASRGISHRQNVRRRLRKIHTDFAVELIEAESEAQRQEFLQEFQYLHHKRWDRKGGSDALTSPEVMHFHDEFSRLALEHGWLRLLVLRLDGRSAACIYGFFYGGVFYFYQSGFDHEFGRYSVGLVAMALSIKKAIAEGAACYDMLHGGEQYKYLWANDERELFTHDCYPPSLHGAFARRVVEARTAMKSVLRKPSAALQAVGLADAMSVGEH